MKATISFSHEFMSIFSREDIDISLSIRKFEELVREVVYKNHPNVTLDFAYFTDVATIVTTPKSAKVENSITVDASCIWDNKSLWLCQKNARFANANSKLYAVAYYFEMKIPGGIQSSSLSGYCVAGNKEEAIGSSIVAIKKSFPQPQYYNHNVSVVEIPVEGDWSVTKF